MTFKELQKSLAKGPRAIRWTNSRIVEIASLQSNGAVRISNFVSGKSYILPRKHSEWMLNLVPEGTTMVTLGDLMPKERK